MVLAWRASSAGRSPPPAPGRGRLAVLYAQSSPAIVGMEKGAMALFQIMELVHKGIYALVVDIVHGATAEGCETGSEDDASV